MALKVRPQWLRQTYEEPLERELAVCDAHHHFWDHGPEDRYLVPELLQDIEGGHRVTSTVYIECGSAYRTEGPAHLRPVGETEFVQRITQAAAGTGIAAGIVGYADLSLGARVEEVLQAHVQASPRFRGIRYWTTWDEHPAEVQLRQTAPRDIVHDKRFLEGYACLERCGLSFDAWMLFPQLADAVHLARTFPRTTLILGHVGGLVGIGPYADREQVFEAWKRRINEAAQCPNIVAKIGGLGIPRLGFGWHERDKPPSSADLAQAFAPYALHCIEQFGPERCMMESNFPVDKASSSYNVVWNAFKRMTESFSPPEREALFHETAERVYRIPG